jgi:hypothetical protein
LQRLLFRTGAIKLVCFRGFAVRRDPSEGFEFDCRLDHDVEVRISPEAELPAGEMVLRTAGKPVMLNAQLLDL